MRAAMQMRGERLGRWKEVIALGSRAGGGFVAGLFVEGVSETTRGHPSMKETTAKHELNTHDAWSRRVGVCR